MNSQPKVDTQWIQGRLKDLRLPQRKLAGLLGMDPGAMSLAIHGLRKLSPDEVVAMAQHLKVDPDEMLARVSNAPVKRAAAPVKRVVTAPREIAGGAFESEFLAKWIDLGLMIVHSRNRV